MVRFPHQPDAFGSCEHCHLVGDGQECAIRLRGMLDIYIRAEKAADTDPIAISVQVVATEYGISEPAIRFARNSGAFLARNQTIATALVAGADPLGLAQYFDLTEKTVKLLALGLDGREAMRRAKRVHDIRVSRGA